MSPSPRASVKELRRLREENALLREQVNYLSWWVRRLDDRIGSMWAAINSAWMSASEHIKKARDQSIPNPIPNSSESHAWMRLECPIPSSGPYIGEKPPQGWLKVIWPDDRAEWWPEAQVIERWDGWMAGPYHARPKIDQFDSSYGVRAWSKPTEKQSGADA